MRKVAPMNLIVHYPKTDEGKEDLARRVADVHASTVIQQLKRLDCPTQQKLDLLDAIIKTVNQRSQSQDRSPIR